MTSQFETLEEDIARLIASGCRSVASEALGELPEGGDSGRRANAPQWARIEARDFLRRIEVANGGDLALCLYRLGRGADREFGVPELRLPEGEPGYILESTTAVLPQSFGHWLRDGAARLIG